jgi:hypothetical protein
MTHGTLNIHVGERKGTSYFSSNPEKERSLERPGQKYENNIKIHLKSIFVECGQLGSIRSLTARRLRYFEHENVILGSI